MSSSVPPPLPDPRFAPTASVAPVQYLAPSTYTLRPVGGMARFWMKVPLPVALACAGLMLLKQFSSGSDFRHDSTHTFILIVDVLFFGAIAAAALLAGLVVLSFTWRRLERGAVLPIILGCVAVPLVGVGTVFASEAVFQWGKTRAYQRVNAAALVADCATMAAAPVTYVSSNGEYAYAGNDPIVPAYTRSLDPSGVAVSARGVYVIMSTDLTSGTQREGYYVPVKPLTITPQAYAMQHQMIVISVQPPVFRF
jgi:hypothetical protein